MTDTFTLVEGPVWHDRYSTERPLTPEQTAVMERVLEAVDEAACERVEFDTRGCCSEEPPLIGHYLTVDSDGHDRGAWRPFAVSDRYAVCEDCQVELEAEDGRV